MTGWQGFKRKISVTALRVRFVAFRRAKQHVVIRFGVERRIEIDEINRLVANVVAEDFQVIAEVESVFSHEGFASAILARAGLPLS